MSFSGNLFVVLLCLDLYEENDVDEDLKAEFLCPFCAEDFDVVGLCCHIDEEHPVEAKNGVLILSSLSPLVSSSKTYSGT